MERDSFASALQRRWWVVILAVVLGGMAGAVPQPRKSIDSVTSYSATHTLLITSNDPNGSISSNFLSPNQLVLLATVGDVPAKVADEIDYPGNAATLASQVTIDPDFSSGALYISTTQSDPDLAVKIADGFAKVLTEFVATRQDDQREQRIAAAQTRLSTLQGEIDSLTAEKAQNPGDATIQAKLDAVSARYGVVFGQLDDLQQQSVEISLVTLQSAQPVAQQSSGLQAPGSRRSRAIFGAIAGGAIGLVAVLVLNLLDRRIRQRSQAESILGVPVQLTIPVVRRNTDRGLAVRKERHDPVSDAYRAMRSVISLAHGDRPDPERGAITLVLSAGPNDGKTTVTANVAAAFAEAGAKAVAVNADFRRPTLSRILGTLGSPAAGASGEGPLRVSPLARGLRVYDERLVDEDATPGELARKTVQTLPWFTSTFSEVVIDTAPVSLAAEVLELLPHADTIVVVVRLGHTRIDFAARTAETLRALGITEFILAVIGGATDRGSHYGYGYRSAYQYTSSSNRGTDHSRRRPEPVVTPEPIDVP